MLYSINLKVWVIKKYSTRSLIINNHANKLNGVYLYEMKYITNTKARMVCTIMQPTFCLRSPNSFTEYRYPLLTSYRVDMPTFY